MPKKRKKATSPRETRTHTSSRRRTKLRRALVLAEGQGAYSAYGSIERRFDISFVAALAQKEKQIQQNYRPVIGVHKWFARRPGSLFRSLLISEFSDEGPLKERYSCAQKFTDRTVLDPFMGGGTPLFEANRMGANVIGADINPMAYWIVRQELSPLDRKHFMLTAERLCKEFENRLGFLYQTSCSYCHTPTAQAKYFLWVKQQLCAGCGREFDLSPGPLVAEKGRHSFWVYYCMSCHGLTEVAREPKRESLTCSQCRREISLRPVAHLSRYTCPYCQHKGSYPGEMAKQGPLAHRLYAIEYHCGACRSSHAGRFFKAPDREDLNRVGLSEQLYANAQLSVPDDVIPDGAETRRLHRWGYKRYRELFNVRQLLGLGTLSRLIAEVESRELRYALATVFSDFLRYQNMLCRYDTMALKCQDIFSVHGYPVGLVQCENNLLGIPGIGSGGYRHFIEKYDRAKAYCESPFETVFSLSGKKRLVMMAPERIEATFVDRQSVMDSSRCALVHAGTIADLNLTVESVDGVFTDPPYFDNVQYAELIDFCYVWLRHLLGDDIPQFHQTTTRSPQELTGNVVSGKDLSFFTEGLSGVFMAAARALKPHSPFVFTYHHNRLEAYAPVCVALLDARLICTAVLPAPAEMAASLHISGTQSSVIDSVVVARKAVHGIPKPITDGPTLQKILVEDSCQLIEGGVRVSKGDLTCIGLGLLMASANRRLYKTWKPGLQTAEKLATVLTELERLERRTSFDRVISSVYEKVPPAAAKGQMSLL